MPYPILLPFGSPSTAQVREILAVSNKARLSSVEVVFNQVLSTAYYSLDYVPGIQHLSGLFHLSCALQLANDGRNNPFVNTMRAVRGVVALGGYGLYLLPLDVVITIAREVNAIDQGRSDWLSRVELLDI